jgi:hypothetical protein
MTGSAPYHLLNAEISALCDITNSLQSQPAAFRSRFSIFAIHSKLVDFVL